ncbi:MAG TPA: acetyl-CoA carboxylase biotin carboxylase subunit [Candidatus Eremiobacteraceae bacterium]|nr:acetyl-CoA carboxylase biotin carboxylase subunit [Candidatus Eremiobacteraceae bacterium]
MFDKVLIANRGEIALRVIRACKELGVATVAVYSDVDRDAAHVTAADEAYRIGPPPAAQSYLDFDAIIETAKRSGADAIHPGYGFLAENAAFARRCEDEKLTFIGPSASLIEMMGDKVAARNAARKAGMPIVPGTTEPVRSPEDAKRLAKTIGYPLAIKAAAGGGGKGLKVARDASEVDQAFSLAAKEAATYFKDGTVYLERYLARPKHVEVQVLGDKHGNAVHVGERDCSLQRRHQKLVEETPATIADTVRQRLLDAALGLAKTIRYDSAGTIECLVEGDEFFFLEMNTRIQVEHTITEAVWGLDLVKAQIRVAAGEALWFSQKELAPRGHAIECRINAESPAFGFRPSAGRIDVFAPSAGPGIRVDAAAYPGWVIPQEYDSLLAKLVAWGEDREEARRRMLRALGEFVVSGVDTTIPLFDLLLCDERFVRGDYATPDVESFVDRHKERIAAHVAERKSTAIAGTIGEPSAETDQGRTVTVEVNDKRFDVRVFGDGPGTSSARAKAPRFKAPKRVAADANRVTAPMHGIVADIKIAPGDSVRDGQVVAIVEAMKMMNEIVAHREGVVKSVDTNVGDTLETGASILTFEA